MYMTAKRSFCIEDFHESGYKIKSNHHQFHFDPKFNARRAQAMIDWIDLHCEGTYITLTWSVHFALKSDALIFKLGYINDQHQ